MLRWLPSERRLAAITPQSPGNDSYFPERALASSLVPNRDVGIQVVGETAGGELIYSGGIFNGIPDAASSTSDTDTNSAKDLAGRVLWQPWRATPMSALNGLGFHLGGSRGSQAGPLPVFRTSAGQAYFTYAIGAVANGERSVANVSRDEAEDRSAIGGGGGSVVGLVRSVVGDTDTSERRHAVDMAKRRPNHCQRERQGESQADQQASHFRHLHPRSPGADW